MKWFLSWKRWGKLANCYQQVLCNPSSKVWYNPLLLNSLDLDVEGLLSQESGLNDSWNKCWMYYVITISSSKFPPYWLARGCTMVYRVANLMKTYYILRTLVVKNNHIGIHLVLNGDGKTWEPKGTKHVQKNIRFGT
jgi:hypothetical protein